FYGTASPTGLNFLTDIVLFADAEVYLMDGLQNENLSARAREEREMILFNFQHIKARFPRGLPLDAGYTQDSSDDNQSWTCAPSMVSDASFPSDYQDDGKLNQKI
uniref:Src kinase associated phosphoprotein 1 n=1 Tax=Crocodylus porosus TaxID=8502 RepID=A0A7M4EHY1_CROPO